MLQMIDKKPIVCWEALLFFVIFKLIKVESLTIENKSEPGLDYSITISVHRLHLCVCYTLLGDYLEPDLMKRLGA